MEISPASRFQATRQLSSADVGGESVVLNLQNGRYFGLNPVAATVLDWLAEPLSLDQLANRLTAKYAVDDARARHDLAQLLTALRKRQLIETVE
jgi:Coenzyme PQQ synthesis protein D (PqqD)